MDNFDINFKELYDVSLKATYPIELSGKKIEEGETIAAFDRIQLANFQENKKFISSNGGFDNRPLIWWEETKEIHVGMRHGVFSKTQLALISNNNLVKSEGQESVKINCRELVETNEKGIAYTKFPTSAPCFIYKKSTGEKLENVVRVSNQIMTNEAFAELLVDYYYEYNNGFEIINFGNALTNGYLSLEGKTRVKDDITGQVKTGIIRIPKLKLLSNLSIQLGNDAIPQVARLDAVAVPAGPKGQKRVMELIFLNDDIDSDM